MACYLLPSRLRGITGSALPSSYGFGLSSLQTIRVQQLNTDSMKDCPRYPSLARHSHYLLIHCGWNTTGKNRLVSSFPFSIISIPFSKGSSV